MRIIVTGGAGFIGSAMIRYLIRNTNYEILNIDKLTYAGNLFNLNEIENNKKYKFLMGDISDKAFIKSILSDFKPNQIINFAAESHVDRSIDSPDDFIRTNITGTFVLLSEVRNYFEKLSGKLKNSFRFLHVSTDEVYGDLETNQPPFNEKNSYQPSSPYSASKAASDHLVRAWHRTYSLPVLITNCSNNYGPYQFPEKLIPLVIFNALAHREIPVYGDGKQIRDWLYVDDHVRGILKVLQNGNIGETFNIGGFNELENIQVVRSICETLDDLVPLVNEKIKSYSELIRFVEDRAGHDKRYAIDSSKIMNELGWKPNENFESGLLKTINWYLGNELWMDSMSSKYNFARLGLYKK